MIAEHRKYFAEIDGLRAIAVLSVVLFHLDFQAFSGGFTGVDVFFVISGFLITRNIYDDLKQNKFHFSSFYYRRFMRLFPAFLVTISVCFLFAFLLFSPSHFKRLSESVLFALPSLSNVYFWQESGYFDSSAQFKPLLHFWSLAVEEQFYLVWPALLVMLFAIHKAKALFIGLIALFVVSLVFSEIMVRDAPETAFYMTPFRMFEFAIGAFCLWLIRLDTGNIIKEIGVASGLVLILWSVFIYDKNTVFPGLSALIPTIGTALVIISTGSRYMGGLLSNRLLVHIGLISYSLYLVHWPVIIFYQYWKGAPLSFAEKLLLLALAFGLAQMMYHFVERQFRLKSNVISQHSPIRRIAPFLIGIVLIAIPSIDAKNHYGWSWRIEATPKQQKFVCRKEAKQGKYERRCEIGAKHKQAEILLLGDSHAIHLLAGLDDLAKKAGKKIDVWTHPGCPPVWGTYKIYGSKNPKRQHTCKVLIPRWEKIMSSGQYKYIILANRWMWLYESVNYGQKALRRDFLVDRENPVHTIESSKKLFQSRMTLGAQKIEDAGSKLIIFSQIPLLGWNIQDCNRLPTYLISPNPSALRCDGGVSYKAAMKRLQFTNETIKNLQDINTMAVIPSDFICDHKTRICKTVIKKQTIYRDQNHLNDTGSLFLAHKIEEAFLRFVGDTKILDTIGKLDNKKL